MISSKELTQIIQRYIETGCSSVGIEYIIKTQPKRIQTQFWDRVQKATRAN